MRQISILNMFAWIILLFIALPAFAQTFSSQTVSTVRARSIGMGGASIGVFDDLAALLNNPACFETYDRPEHYRFTVFLNPVLPAVSLKDPKKTGIDNNESAGKAALNLSYLFKGIAFSTDIVDFGVILFEESIIDKSTSEFFDPGNFQDTYFHSFGGRIRLAKRLSLGGTLSMYSKPGIANKVKGGATSYGILLSPTDKINIGVVYYDMTKGFSKIRERIEGYRDESINAGMSYLIKKFTRFAFDLKSINTNDKQEYHFGMESSFYSHIALRAGYTYTPKDKVYSKSRNIFTFGAGLLDQNRFRSINNRFLHKDYILDYSLVIEDILDGNYLNWHFLTVKIRF